MSPQYIWLKKIKIKVYDYNEKNGVKELPEELKEKSWKELPLGVVR